MSSSTRDEVLAILDACAKKGEAIPSLRTIRAQLGGIGSYSTITEAVQYWRESRLPKSTLTSGLGTQVMKTIETAIWEEVRPLMEKAAADARADAISKVAIEREEAQRLKATADELIKEAESQKAQLKDALEAKISMARQVLELKGGKEVAEAKLKATEELLQETQGQLKAAQAQIDALQKALSDAQASYITKLEELAAKPSKAPSKRSGASKGKSASSASKNASKNTGKKSSNSDSETAEKTEAN